MRHDEDMLRKLGPLVLLVSLAHAGIVEDVRSALAQSNLAAADAELRAYRAHNPVTPEYLEALSWMARGALAAGHLDTAQTAASQTLAQAGEWLKTRALDADPHLPTALGAAYEVQAQVLVEQGKRAQAVATLRSALAKYSGTSIRARLQKNLNLITLVGQAAPELEVAQFLGSKPATLAQLKGKPVLLFFWAHWCQDCKAEVPIIARLQQEFSGQGLTVVGPTRYYGYTAQQEHAAPATELPYMEAVRQRFYSNLNMTVPVSARNFDRYGASTTPTLVLLDRGGRVALYHPGAMFYEDLRAAVAKVVTGPAGPPFSVGKP